MFDKLIDSKKYNASLLLLSLLRHKKTRASGLTVEESNVETVVPMNQRRDNFFLLSELLLL